MLIDAALQTGVGCFECLKHDKHVNKVFLKYYFGFVLQSLNSKFCLKAFK